MYLNYTYQFAIYYVWGYPTTLRSVDYLISHKARIWNLNQNVIGMRRFMSFFVSEKSGKLANLVKTFPYPYHPCMVYLPTFTINLSQM